MGKTSKKVLAETATLSGRALDWAVDNLLRDGDGYLVIYNKDYTEWMFFWQGLPYPQGPEPYSSDQKSGGELIQDKMISCVFEIIDVVAGFYDPQNIPEPPHLAHAMRGDTVLEAACRAFLSRSHGNVVSVPIELLDQSKAAFPNAKQRESL